MKKVSLMFFLAAIIVGLIAVTCARSELTVHAQKTIAIGAAETTGTATIDVRGGGKLLLVVMAVPNWTNAVTTTLSIAGPYGNTIWTDSSARARNATYNLYFGESGDPVKIPLVGNHTITATLSGAPGAGGGTITLTIYTEKTP